MTGEYIVTFHAIELGLKAFLIKNGMSAERLRKKPYGHNLTELFEAAARRGLTLGDPDARGMLQWANEWHSEGVKIRYEFAEPRELPICSTLFPLTEAIINASR